MPLLGLTQTPPLSSLISCVEQKGRENVEKGSALRSLKKNTDTVMLEEESIDQIAHFCASDHFKGKPPHRKEKSHEIC